MPTVPQVRRIIFNDEEIGMGFNSQSGLAVGTALDGFTIQENPAAPGAEVTASILIVNTHEDLQEQLGMSFEAQGRYGFFSASAKAKFAETTKFNTTSTFLVARCIVENPLRRGKGFKVTAAAQALLDANRFDEFRNAFGDSFIRGLQTGGEFYAVIRITSTSASTQSELSATLQAEMNGLVTAGSFKAGFDRAQSNASTRSEFTATMYQNAGAGSQIAPTVSIEEVTTRFKQFPEIAKANAAAYETEVATYDTIPLPTPTPEEREDFLLALSDAREKKLRYIQTRNDLQFALQNPLFFEELPPATTLNDAIVVYTKLINAVMAHAVKLSRGQVVPPQMFDGTLLTPPITEPAPVPLRRKNAGSISLAVGPMSSTNFPRVLRNVPDSFEATTHLTVRFPRSASGKARHAGLALFEANGTGYDGITRRLDAGGQLVGRVSGNAGAAQIFPFVGPKPYGDDSVHLRLTVKDRRVREVAFSTDGATWEEVGGGSIGSATPRIKQLMLFAFAEDDATFVASFAEPKVVDLSNPPG